MFATSLPVAQWLERSTGVRKVMGWIQILSFSHARDMLNIPSFLNSEDVIRKKIDSLRQVLNKSQIRKTL